MRRRIAVSIVISVLVASVFGASYVTYTAVLANPTHSFTLQLTGTANDPQGHGPPVNIVLSLTGSTNGILNTVMVLFVKGDYLSVDRYGVFDVSRGSGALISSCHYIALCLWVTPKYGGKIAFWCMSGKTKTLSEKILQVSLWGSDVVLPTAGFPRLDDVSLFGTLTLS